MNSTATCVDRFDQLTADFHARYNLSSGATPSPTPTSAPTWPPTLFPDSADPNVKSIQVREGCGPTAVYESFATPLSANGIVVNITKIEDAGQSHSTPRVIISNCDGGETFNTTTAGVVVMQSPEFLVAVQREPPSQTAAHCGGSARVEYIVKPLNEYCKIYSGLSECAAFKESSESTSKAPATASSQATGIRRSVVVSIFSACVMIAAGGFRVVG